MPEPSRKSVAILFAAVCVAGLAALIYFARSAATRAAPDYSTWNTGPEGAKLLFDGLKEAGFQNVSRQFRPVSVERPSQSTVFFLGMEAWNLDEEGGKFFDTMESAAKRGNDLVIAIPESAYTFKSDEKEKLLEKRWGVRFVSDKNMFSDHPIVDKNWKELPSAGQDVWQRPFGTGAITLVAKSQRLSNTGIAREPANRQLLYQLAVQYPAVIFEESHLGIQESGSIVGLARHYHLQGLMAGLIFLAGMFVWSHSVRFPPPPLPEEAPVAGTDTRSMLTELMSRHLRKELIAACVNEWNRTAKNSVAIKPPTEADSVKAYAQIQETLKQKSRPTL